MGPIQLHHQIPFHPTTLEKATESVHGHIQVDEVVKTMIDKISSTVFLKGEGSTTFSPVSITPVLGMMLASMGDNRDKEKLLGIPEGSLTPELEVEIHQKLGEFSRSHPYNDAKDPNDDTTVATCNFSVSDYHTPDEQYQKIISEHYLAQKPEDSDKNVADITDDFVRDKTNNRITTLFDGLTESERHRVKAVLGNVMEIKAIWEMAFSPDDTHRESFMCEDGKVIENVSMMDITGDFPIAMRHGFAATSKKFMSVDGKQLELVVITPIEISASKIENLLHDRSTITELMDQLSHAPNERIKLVLPKMEISSSDDELLQTINDALNIDITAQQLSKLGTEPSDQLDMIQKIKASIDERGARAVVASAATIFTRDMFISPPLKKFTVDCPSFVVITDGKENLLEVVLRCGKFFTTDGPAEITPAHKPTNVEKHKYVTDDHLKFPPSPIQPSSLHQEVKKDDGLDLNNLIQSKLNPNREFEIKDIRKHNVEVSIAVGSLEQAEELAKKLVEFLGAEHKNFVQVWSCFDPVRVDVSFKAMETLIEKLTS